MKFLDEFRDPDLAAKWLQATLARATRHWTIMEVCGGQTHAIIKHGLDEKLLNAVTLIHGPGCPVCVTPTTKIDQAIALAAQGNVTLCTFGDMLRVPGSGDNLLAAKARGADVRTLYSPLDGLAIAQQHPDREVVFFAIGFETTAPVVACTLLQAQQLGLSNFSILCALTQIPPAIDATLRSSMCRIQALLAPGHVCTVTGYRAYEQIVLRHNIPIIVTGFEPVDILQGIYLAVRQLEKDQAELENQYRRSVHRDGNESALKLVKRIFCTADRNWRGLGNIPSSGLELREHFQIYDAARRFKLSQDIETTPAPCLGGSILKGLKKPYECPAFADQCTPETPLGALMVSSEGACAAYYRYNHPSTRKRVRTDVNR